MSALIGPAQLADSVRRRLTASTCDINAYWITLTGEREAYATALREELTDDPVVVIILRDSRFTNPNALLSDFVELVEEHRASCESCLASATSRCGFVLLSRMDLRIPQVSSPVVLPSWFPINGGTTVSMVIEDVTWTADAALEAGESRLGELSELLLDCEAAIIARVRAVEAADHRRVNALLDHIRRDPDESLQAILDAAEQHHLTVTTPSAYRPSLRDGRSLVSRLWGVVQARQPEQLKAPSKALADALGLVEPFDAKWHVEPFLGPPPTVGW